ncbi:thermonuclease family protein [Flavobacterium psychrophilum]|uniref:thermonuclease family protein n=1 Tax=Flavobacterium psychrophilum TaxID=96345 RepID=UPI001D076E27|nr:thermonuclease family protein [Flavobacterium psychrophilum]MCB5972671.1 thermonuclease family protein [Flavobacterium psychrophilum]MCB5979002.1 thermonuclease family protein [Flavobacterium psychrophilum]MCB5983276.1 thermonuclease family protein [Flavobacterium psychrophilum]
MKKQKFVYEAKVLDIHDGDTISIEIDLGFQMRFTDKVRFYGINAPELKIRNEKNKMTENQLGIKTLNTVKEFIKIGDVITIETIKDKKEKYGRYLANVYVLLDDRQICLNDYLLNNGLAVPMKY